MGEQSVDLWMIYLEGGIHEIASLSKGHYISYGNDKALNEEGLIFGGGYVDLDKTII